MARFTRPTVEPNVTSIETATTADEVSDVLIAALNVTGGEEALFERRWFMTLLCKKLSPK